MFLREIQTASAAAYSRAHAGMFVSHDADAAPPIFRCACTSHAATGSPAPAIRMLTAGRMQIELQVEILMQRRKVCGSESI